MISLIFNVASSSMGHSPSRASSPAGSSSQLSPLKNTSLLKPMYMNPSPTADVTESELLCPAEYSCRYFRIISTVSLTSSWVMGMSSPRSWSLSPSGPKGRSSVLTSASLLKLRTISIHFSSLMVDMEYSSTKKHSSSVTMSP